MVPAVWMAIQAAAPIGGEFLASSDSWGRLARMWDRPAQVSLDTDGPHLVLLHGPARSTGGHPADPACQIGRDCPSAPTSQQRRRVVPQHGGVVVGDDLVGGPLLGDGRRPSQGEHPDNQQVRVRVVWLGAHPRPVHG